MALKNFHTKGLVEAGWMKQAEACLAGPVVAAAVILPSNFRNQLLDDSKKMSEKDRFELEPLIKEKALAYAIGVVDHTTIDKINILNASFLAMHRAIEQLKITPDLLLIDGNRFKKYKEIDHLCIIKGDGKYKSIAAASVLAKVHRDRLMDEYHEQFPHYAWHQNKGYPTELHRMAIKKHGASALHRMSFTLLKPEQLKISF
ncbi:MAG: ribonuclease HII [Crocinitomicaceae bacterium]|nr:ribonuclease HII [Crocinitomicaceae bacterium]